MPMVDLPRGTLLDSGRAKLGLASYEWKRCITCRSEFPIIDGETKCNGHVITKCPWCREDSKPGTNGRGL